MDQAALRDCCPPRSHIMKCILFHTTSSTFEPIVGEVCTTSFIKNWYNMVVLPALSKPIITILCSKTIQKHDVTLLTQTNQLSNYRRVKAFKNIYLRCRSNSIFLKTRGPWWLWAGRRLYWWRVLKTKHHNSKKLIKITYALITFASNIKGYYNIQIKVYVRRTVYT